MMTDLTEIRFLMTLRDIPVYIFDGYRKQREIIIVLKYQNPIISNKT